MYVLLVFWNQCISGRTATPSLKAAHEAFPGDDRFVMLSVSADTEGERQNTSEWVQEHNLKWVVTFIDRDQLLLLRNDYGVYGGLSESGVFLIGPEGKVVARNLQGEGIEEAVAEGLGEN